MVEQIPASEEMLVLFHAAMDFAKIGIQTSRNQDMVTYLAESGNYLNTQAEALYTRLVKDEQKQAEMQALLAKFASIDNNHTTTLEEFRALHDEYRAFLVKWGGERS